MRPERRQSRPRPARGPALELASDAGGKHELRILGPLEVRRDGETLGLGGARQRSLLALLILHRNEVVPRERLIDALWGEQPPATAANALQVAVHGLRKCSDMNACAAAAGSTSSSWSRASSTSTSSSAPTIALLLDAETFVRIAPQTRRRLRSGPEGARLLLIGGTPGRAYAPTANTELGGPEVLDSPTASSAMLPGGPPPMLST